MQQPFRGLTKTSARLCCSHSIYTFLNVTMHTNNVNNNKNIFCNNNKCHIQQVHHWRITHILKNYHFFKCCLQGSDDKTVNVNAGRSVSVGRRQIDRGFTLPWRLPMRVSSHSFSPHQFLPHVTQMSLKLKISFNRITHHIQFRTHWGRRRCVVYQRMDGNSKCFTVKSRADQFNRTRYQLLWEVFSHAAIKAAMLKKTSRTQCTPLPLSRFSSVQSSELEERGHNSPRFKLTTTWFQPGFCQCSNQWLLTLNYDNHLTLCWSKILGSDDWIKNNHNIQFIY